jgi:hypothetical protein
VVRRIGLTLAMVMRIVLSDHRGRGPTHQ